MKYTIHGFSQDIAVKLKLNSDDLLLLRWFVDFQGTGLMNFLVIDDKPHYWIKYSKVIQDMPIIADKEDTIYRKFKKLVESNVLKLYTKREKTNGHFKTYPYYGFDVNYKFLVTSPSNNQDIKDTDYTGLILPCKVLGKKSEEQVGKKSEQLLGKKSVSDSSIIKSYSSTKKIDSQSIIRENKQKSKNKKDDGLMDEFNSYYSSLDNYLRLEDVKIITGKPELVDEIKLNIAEMYISKSIKIKDDIKPQAIIRHSLSRLTCDHIIEVVNRFLETSKTTKIKNTKSYLQAMIYNEAYQNEATMNNIINSVVLTDE
jgi:hypothetical protein